MVVHLRISDSNGRHISMLAPMPESRSGGCPRPFTATRSDMFPTLRIPVRGEVAGIVKAAYSLVRQLTQHVLAWSRSQPRMATTPQALPGLAKRTGAGRQPAGPVRPLVDGFCRTGDAGAIVGPHLLKITGRKKDMIDSGGENIYPAEIEAILTDHPSIKDATVIAVPDPRFQGAVCAVVTASPAPRSPRRRWSPTVAIVSPGTRSRSTSSSSTSSPQPDRQDPEVRSPRSVPPPWHRGGLE